MNSDTAPHIAKPHREFFRIAFDTDPLPGVGWRPVAGFDGRIQELILADNLDPLRCRGSRTRLARWAPGTLLPAPVSHDFHEEVFLVSGDLVVGCDAHGEGGEVFLAHTYACRPPAVPHGPFVSRGGCVMLEFQYYDALG